MPFKEASDYLEKLLKISVSEETIETYVKHIGKAISVDEKEMVSKTIDSDGYVKEKILKKEFSASCESPKKTGAAYMQLDGTMVQTREEQWKEVRNGLIFSQKDMLQVDKHHKKIANKVYFSTFNHKDTSLQQFKNRATQVAHDFEFHRYEKPVVLGDGARWIWDYVDQCHPDAIQILDYYHANEYLGNAFKSLTFANNDEDKKQKNILQKLWFDWLWEGQINLIISALLDQTQTPEIQACIRYYKNNQSRMNYKTYRNAGLEIGSGAIESAHRIIVQCRMKQSGMHWKKRTFNLLFLSELNICPVLGTISFKLTSWLPNPCYPLNFGAPLIAYGGP